MASISPEESLKNLSLLALFISTYVSSAMRAALVTTAANAFFNHKSEERGARFHTNPANTLPYSSLSALESHSIVTVAEFLNDEHHIFPVNTVIRRKDDLFLHRHAISHPATVKWKPKMQSFVDKKRNYQDLRPALLWDLNKSINEELTAHGQETYFDKLVVGSEMAHMLRLILELSRRDGLILGSVDDYGRYLNEQAPKYIAGLEKWIVEHDATLATALRNRRVRRSDRAPCTTTTTNPPPTPSAPSSACCPPS